MTDIETHPVQARHVPCRISTKVSLLAYEVYSEVFGPQAALVTGGCRGGFSASELIAFLYARSFPRTEWRQRVDEALIGVKEPRYIHLEE
jgi:hypothetical protein